MPDADPHQPLPQSVAWWRTAVETLAVATGGFAAFGLLAASQIKLTGIAFGREMPWKVALTGGLTESLAWVPVALPVVWLARRFALLSPRWPVHLAILTLGGLAAIVGYAGVNALANEYLIPESLQMGRYFRPKGPPPQEATRENAPTSGARDSTPRTEGPPPPPPDGERDRERRGRPRGRDTDPFGTGVWERMRFLVTTRWHANLLVYSAIIGVVHWARQQQRLREREAHARELSRQLAEARLQALRMQLNPHFLFNTLNAIATLVHRAPLAADEMISSLSDFLRLTLQADNRPQTTLDRELEFARRYLDIEKARFGERLTIRESIDPACLPCLVPTLVLQPLLENAVRHGIEPLERPGTITLQARRPGDHLVLTITDTGAGLVAKKEERTGIGLSNTRQRLCELHGHSASLDLREAEGGGLCVELRIPWSIVPATSESPDQGHAAAHSDR